ncbi:transcription factor with AP2 domain(s) [Reticulomyxa filosa]|uniref:Transcription factor with AP2 domain(S) n=1 Tax=Reticulomyxa filosa TaxID=46433 RepID=X6N0P8_RETFI|nr:transcription factor with AP2 domain(s) [Reticulomyxa filosa]|eukprot:ETO19468.1 transcription factor with AP2 domain(s) [Reticulomyxa filosa]
MSARHHEGQVRCVGWHPTNSRLIITGGDDATVRVWRLYPASNFASVHSTHSQNNVKKKKKKEQETKDTSETTHPTNADNTEHGILLHVFCVQNFFEWLYCFPPFFFFLVGRKLKQQNKKKGNYSRRSSESDIKDKDMLLKRYDPSLQNLHHLLAMTASGMVCALGISPHFNGALVCAVSARNFNKKSCLDMYQLPHWTWNYSSVYRLPLRLQQKRNIVAPKSLQHLQQTDNRPSNRDTNDNNPITTTTTTNDNNNNNNNNTSKNNNDYADILEYDKDFVEHPSVIPLPYGATERGLCFTHIPEVAFVG